MSPKPGAYSAALKFLDMKVKMHSARMKCNAAFLNIIPKGLKSYSLVQAVGQKVVKNPSLAVGSSS